MESIDPTHFDIDLPEEILDQAVEMQVTEQMAGNGKHLKDLSLPVGALVMLIRRGDRYIVPKGHTLILPNDYLLLISEDQSALIRQEEAKIWELQFIEHPITFLSQRALKQPTEQESKKSQPKNYENNKKQDND